MSPNACPRCGTFASLSAFWGRSLCSPCIERQPRVFRGAMGVEELCSALWAIPLRVWLVSIAFHLLANIPALIRTFHGVSGLRGHGADLLLDSIAACIVTHVCVQRLRGEPAGVGAAIRAMGQRAGTLFRVEFLGALMVLVFTLLLVVPGILRALSLALTIPIVLFENTSSFEETADRSTARMKGQRGTALSAYVITFLPALLALVAGAFLADEADLSVRARLIETLTEALSVILGSATTLVTALLYVSLTPPHILPLEPREAAGDDSAAGARATREGT